MKTDDILATTHTLFFHGYLPLAPVAMFNASISFFVFSRTVKKSGYKAPEKKKKKKRANNDRPGGRRSKVCWRRKRLLIRYPCLSFVCGHNRNKSVNGCGLNKVIVNFVG